MVSVGPSLIDTQVLFVVDGDRFQAPRARSAVIVVEIQFGPVAVSAQGGPVGDRTNAPGERERDRVDRLDARRLGAGLVVCAHQRVDGAGNSSVNAGAGQLVGQAEAVDGPVDACDARRLEPELFAQLDRRRLDITVKDDANRGGAVLLSGRRSGETYSSVDAGSRVAHGNNPGSQFRGESPAGPQTIG